jgi:16S rRNA (guanine966-N2)-methyltransferase
VPAAPGLRPTPDRVRETLFNWLQGRLAGARCLDLFAGSGALGFEAASRGAAEVVMVERGAQVARHLRAVAAGLPEAPVRVIRADALRFLRDGNGGRFDVVFLDPPYGSGLLERVLRLLPGALCASARVYAELPTGESLPLLPEGWRVIRSTRAGEVGAYLIEVGGEPMKGGSANPQAR